MDVAPFGVDVADYTTIVVNCGNPGGQCITTNTIAPLPLVTLRSSSQLFYNGLTIAVGAQPAAVKAYHYVTTGSGGRGGGRGAKYPTNAVVTNYGSNTVCIVDLVHGSLVQTISVGTEPTAIVLKSDETKAYVANFGSANISEIDLTANTQTRIMAVGGQPAALSMDASGTALWVGGINFISKLDQS